MAEKKRFLLRMSPELWEELNRWAAQEFRSVNAQIEFILQRAVDERRRPQRAARSRTERPVEEDQGQKVSSRQSGGGGADQD